jgi:cyclopropane fatty-acyl-phospholipid synthase-like methyltransferase
VTPAGVERDASNGWEAIARVFMGVTVQGIGAKTIADWARTFGPGQAILDVGCGFGRDYTRYLVDSGAGVYALDASPTLLQEYHARFPHITVACEAAEDSPFFGRQFNGVLSVGLVFLLTREQQVIVLQKMAAALAAGGRLLFTAPADACEWDDLLTGRKSRSLGKTVYVEMLRELELLGEYTDEGENHYYDFRKRCSQ